MGLCARVLIHGLLGRPELVDCPGGRAHPFETAGGRGGGEGAVEMMLVMCCCFFSRVLIGCNRVVIGI